MSASRSTASNLSAGLAGLLFGLGLVLAGMADPNKVLAFLDVAGPWDPSLGLVMGAAIPIGAVAFALARRRSSSLLGLPIELPRRTDVDVPLVLGAALFGVGWGLSGICPGPALVSVASGHAEVLFFVVPMWLGIALVDARRRAGDTSEPAEAP
jgi:uncharacterized membrane protein YedE/YeeE